MPGILTGPILYQKEDEDLRGEATWPKSHGNSEIELESIALDIPDTPDCLSQPAFVQWFKIFKALFLAFP